MIKIICFGKIKELYLKDLISDYKDRINKYHKLEIIELKDNDDIKKETNELLKYLNPKEYNIALCIDGKKISFSKFTFPHGLFRGILLEQIYRSLKINNNEAYHK